jgi:hypothetical protein
MPLAAGVWVFTLARVASAKPVAEASFDFSAPAGCIDSATFRGRILKLEASRADVDPPRSVSVRIVEEGDGFAAQLTATHGDGRITTRNVAAADCDAVVEALEFVFAVAFGLDTVASTKAPPAPIPETAQELPPPTPPTPSLASQESARWRPTGAAFAGFVGGLGPRLAFAPSISVGAMFDTRAVFAPAFEITGTWAEGGAVAMPLGTTSLSRLDAAASGCPLRFALGRGVALRPCAELTYGSVRASASGATLVGETTATRPWAAAGAFARAEWRVAPALLLDAQAGATFALLQDRFYFTPSTTIYELPLVSGAFKLGAHFVWL